MPTDFNREVHCILGLPFDAVTMPEVVQRIRDAAAKRTPCFLSTPNLNFLIASQSDTTFRNSVINCDLSTIDGTPIVWIARLLGIPIRERVAGSDLFNRLRATTPKPLTVYFFGGMEGVAATACQKLNTPASGIVCIGFESPGFGSVQEMSSDASINKINASGADFLLISLGAKKGQAWIEHNRARVSVPVLSHLGAVINFVAGTVERAPIGVQRLGLEWLWRIKEEPGLWRRYAADGLTFIRLLTTRVIPYAWLRYWHKPASQQQGTAAIELLEDAGVTIIRLRGAWEKHNLGPLRDRFFSIAHTGKDVRIELEQVSYVDSAFIGLLMLLYGDRKQQGKRLAVCDATKRVRKIFRLSCAEFLLD